MGNAIGGTIGGTMKKTMEDNMKQQQEFMVASQKMNMERQMTMQQLMAKKQMSMQIARTKEMFNWIAGFTGTLSCLLIVGSIKKKNPVLLGPILPISFLVGYQYDMVYGNKLERIRKDAEFILNNEEEKVSLPNGPVTFDVVENERTKCQ